MVNPPGKNRLEEIDILRFGGGNRLGSYGEGISYSGQRVLNADSQRVGAELLVTHKKFETQKLLNLICRDGKSLFLFQRGLIEAFCRIALGEAGITGYRAVNTYIADIADPAFQDVVRGVMKSFKESDRKRIKIEIVETPFGEINGRFIANVIWLKQQGFIIDVDDYDLFGVADDMSRELLRVIVAYIDGIKIDWKTAQVILRDPELRDRLIGLRNQTQKRITLEGVRGEAQIKDFRDTGADHFQISEDYNFDSLFDRVYI